MPVLMTIKVNSVQFKLKWPAETELRNKYILLWVGVAGVAYACFSDNKANLSSIEIEIVS